VSYPVTLIPGDGIGPEVAEAAARAVDATGVAIDWDCVDLNPDVILKAGDVLPPHVLDSLNRTRTGLKGPVTTPVAGGFQRERSAAETPGSVRERAADSHASRSSHAVFRCED